jgi:dipeptidase E
LSVNSRCWRRLAPQSEYDPATMRLLLISNSTRHGERYLDHCADAIRSLLGTSIKRVLFVPYAIHDHSAYAATVRSRFDLMAYAVDAVHDAKGGPLVAVEQAQAIFIGGGNTFRLIDALWRYELIEPIRRRVQSGLPYIGTSAGANVACPSIRTTNDMPIVQPPSFAALDLVPFNINAHYQDPIEGSTHMGETREQRIAEFHEENTPAVVGLREGAWLHVEGEVMTLEGKADVRLFRRGQPPVEHPSGSRLDFLLIR